MNFSRLFNVWYLGWRVLPASRWKLYNRSPLVGCYANGLPSWYTLKLSQCDHWKLPAAIQRSVFEVALSERRKSLSPLRRPEFRAASSASNCDSRFIRFWPAYLSESSTSTVLLSGMSTLLYRSIGLYGGGSALHSTIWGAYLSAGQVVWHWAGQSRRRAEFRLHSRDF